MPAIPDLFEVQAAEESVWGTPVTPTVKLGLVEEFEITPENEAENMKELRASLAPGYTATLSKQKASGKMSGILSYEDFPYLLDALFGKATPTGANPYVRAYTGPGATVPARKVMTLVKGQGSYVYGLTSAVLKELTIKVEAGQPVKYDSSWVGYLMQTDALAVLSDRTLTPIQAANGALYMDAWGGTIGTTAITTTWFSGEIKYASNADVYFGIGSAFPKNYREAKWDVKSKMTLELDATSKGFLDSIIGTTLLQKQMRWKFTTGASAIVQLDLAGSFLKAPAFAPDQDGVTTLDLDDFTGLYNTTLGSFAKASVTNAVSVLP